jgi:hypothetical protein
MDKQYPPFNDVEKFFKRLNTGRADEKFPSFARIGPIHFEPLGWELGPARAHWELVSPPMPVRS